MVRKTSKRRAAAARPVEFTSRDVVLAGIGALSLGRKQGLRIAGDLKDQVGALRERTATVLDNLGAQLDSGVAGARSRLQSAVAALRKRAATRLQQARGQAAQRLSPLLARFGLSRPSARRSPVKRAAARKASARRSKPAARRRRAA